MLHQLIICISVSAIIASPRIQIQPVYALADKEQTPTKQEATASVDDLSDEDDASFIFRAFSGFRNVDIDGVQSSAPDTISKVMKDLPTPKFDDENKDFAPMPFDGFTKESASKDDFLKAQPGVVPKFTGSFLDEKTEKSAGLDYFEGPISNPAAFYLEGANFEKIPVPKCQMVGCTGPFPNDGSLDFSEAQIQEGQTCHQTFVPLNGCTSNKGYPMGMLCQICCDCSKPFVKEFMKTKGYKEGYTQ